MGKADTSVLARPAPRAVMAAEARKLIDFHGGDWDSLHAFTSVLWDGEKAAVQTMAAIDTALDPRRYPAVMRGMAAEELAKDDYAVPYAYGFEFEAFTVTTSGMTEAEKAVAESRHHARTLDTHPSRRECVFAYVADIHGRTWMARKFRDADGLDEQYWAPGQNPGGAGTMLKKIARSTAFAAWGLHPLPGEDEQW